MEVKEVGGDRLEDRERGDSVIARHFSLQEQIEEALAEVQEEAVK